MVGNITLNATNITTIFNSDLNTIVSEIKPLMILVIAIFIYSVFIFKFYRFLAEKDIIKKDWHRKYTWQESFFEKIMKTSFYILEHLIITPIATFFWFIVLASLILLLSNNEPSQILLVSMGIIGAIRMAAHYNTDLSKDLAKMIPFAFLGVYIIDMKLISFEEIIARGTEFFGLIHTMSFFLIFIVILELSMRIIQATINKIKTKKKETTN